jgi:beta-mannanase
MLRILVPAVGPESDESQIRRWIADLEFLHRQHADLPQASAAIEWRLEEAWRWLLAKVESSSSDGK